MKKTVTFVTFLFFYSTSWGQTKKDLNIDFMLEGNIYAQSSIVDTAALGGFGRSDNAPKKYNDHLNSAFKELLIQIDTSQVATINNKYNGYKLFIGNRSDTTAKFDASDSRLYVVAEILYKDKWQPIEYLSGSSCGNSYHCVFLKQNEYWEFNVPKFDGQIKTKLRYRLEIGKEKYIYSNEINTAINEGQLIAKRGQQNESMNPYYD